MTSPENTSMIELSVPVGRNRRPRPPLETEGGSMRGFSFSIRWAKEDNVAGVLTFHLAGKPVGMWGGASLDAAGLARFLISFAEAWPYLRVEETYPQRVTPRKPSELETALLEKPNSHEVAMRQVTTFRTRHDVTSWCGDLSSTEGLILLREGNFFVAEGNGRVLRLPYGDVLRTLCELGDAVAGIVERHDPTPRSRAVQAWRSREDVPADELEGIASGIDVERVVQMRRILPRRTAAEIFAGMDEVRAAARGLAPVMTNDDIERVADVIRAEPRRDCKELNLLARRAERKLASLSGEACPAGRSEGLSMARWFRTTVLGIGDDDRFDVESYLASLDVPVSKLAMETEVEAVAFWGRSHGPGIILNPAGRRSRAYRKGSDGGARFTLAHELCHLLLDTRGSLPVAEVLRRMGHSMVEERANAFAAEVLLPELSAARIYRNGDELDGVIDEITKHFGVTRTLAAWQLYKSHPLGSPVLPEADRQRLRKFVNFFDRSPGY